MYPVILHGEIIKWTCSLSFFIDIITGVTIGPYYSPTSSCSADKAEFRTNLSYRDEENTKKGRTLKDGWRGVCSVQYRHSRRKNLECLLKKIGHSL